MAVFLDRPPPFVETWLVENISIVNDKLRLVVETTSSYKKSGIYLA